MSLGRQFAGKKYRTWMQKFDRPIEPCVRGPGCVALGLNTAHGVSPSRLFKGYLNRDQRARAREVFQATPPGHLKVLFCHHPLVWFKSSFHKTMFGADAVRDELMAAGTDLFLWGHQHSFDVARLERPGRTSFAVQGPTLSGRVRGGKHPGFVVVDWLFKEKITVRSLNITGDKSVEEDRRVEYPL
jgi:hypothetical protein